MYREQRKQIELLRNKAADLRAKATSQTERDFAAKLEDEAKGIEMELPAHEPLSRPGSQYAAGARALGNSNDHFQSFGQQLVAVARAATPGGQTDPRLYRAAASGLNEAVPSQGGFLVQQDFSTELLQGLFTTGLLASRCNRIRISGNSNSIKLPAPDETSRADGSRWGGVLSYWKDEAAQATATKPKFRALQLSLNKLLGFCYATDELLQDSSVLETVIRQAFQDELGFKIDDAIINGSGSGMPLGILPSGCLVSVPKESGQQAATVVFENIVKMYSRMPGRNRANAAWLISQSVESQLFQMSLQIGTGGSAVYLPGGGVSAAPFATLFGRPVLPVEQCKVLGTQGDIVFADLGSYILADKGDLQSDMSIHVRFEYMESCFRFSYRCDGQPLHASSITPFDGGDPVSPFVALATRS